MNTDCIDIPFDEIKTCIVTDIDYENDLIFTLELLKPGTRELFRLQVAASGVYCDDIWLAYSIEKID